MAPTWHWLISAAWLQKRAEYDQFQRALQAQIEAWVAFRAIGAAEFVRNTVLLLDGVPATSTAASIKVADAVYAIAGG